MSLNIKIKYKNVSVNFTVRYQDPIGNLKFEIQKNAQLGKPDPEKQILTTSWTKPERLVPDDKWQKYNGKIKDNDTVNLTLADEDLGYYDHYGKASKAAVDYSGYKDRDTIEVYISTLGPNKGKVIGFNHTSNSYRIRLDYDPDKGLHYNVEFPSQAGKKKKAFLYRVSNQGLLPGFTKSTYDSEVDMLQKLKAYMGAEGVKNHFIDYVYKPPPRA